MYRGDKEEGPEQILRVHRALESAVLTNSHGPEQTACATSGMTQTMQLQYRLLRSGHAILITVSSDQPCRRQLTNPIKEV